MRSFTLANIMASFLVTAVSAHIQGSRFLHGRSARGLQSNETDGPRGPCSMALIRMAEPATVSDYLDCVGKLVNESDLRVAGANFDITHTCWCRHGMQELMREFQCCDNEDFRLLCQADCSPECTRAAATTCVDECPAICLEGDYSPGDICQNCAGCEDHMKCIVDHAKDRTAAGDPDHPRICDDRKFDTSEEYYGWQDCFTDHPKRTHWHRTNAEHHCYCHSDLKAAAERNGCCGATWGRVICEDACADATATNLCDTDEAKECMAECGQKCAAVHPDFMVEECRALCSAEGSRCEKYKVCEPVGPFEHGYICDDGSRPPDNGCCTTHPRTGLPVCPGLCDSSQTYELRHGYECQCRGCPESIDAAKSKFNSTLYNNLRENGWAVLTDITRRVGLDYPSNRMNEMMQSRNDAIMAAWQEHPGAIDEAFQQTVNEISAKWRDLIIVEAQREKDFGPAPEPTPTPAPPTEGIASAPAEEEDSAPIIIIVIASIGGSILIFAILVMVYKIKSSSAKNANPGAGASGTSPIEGDPNVVVGRPVEGGSQGSAATAGAPVQMSGKGSESSAKSVDDGPAKSDSAPPQFAKSAVEA